jgi:hypothetical protein
MNLRIIPADAEVFDEGGTACIPAAGPRSLERGLAMVRAFSAACRDFLGPSALSVLGPVQYRRLCLALVSSLPQILRTRAFAPVYRAMGMRPIRVGFKNRSFLIDCPYADERIDFGTHSFILIRELFIRNCYIRDSVARIFPRVRTALDLGANRGLFSTMMATRAEKVIAVEVMPRYVDVIRRNMEANGLGNYAIEIAFVGAGGTAADCSEAADTRTIPEILDRHALSTVDLVKMDIEGSEFALFESAAWLERVSALCMEVHPDHGDVEIILRALAHRRFEFSMRDRRLRSTIDLPNAMYIYAVRKG